MADEEPPVEEAVQPEEGANVESAENVEPSEVLTGEAQEEISKTEEEPTEPQEVDEIVDETKAEGVEEVEFPAEEQTEEQAEDQTEDQTELPGLEDATEDLPGARSSLFIEASEEMKKEGVESKHKIAERKKIRALGSILSIRRGREEYYDRAKAPRYANSYKLESDKPFNSEKVENILKDVLIEALENLSYDSDNIPKQAKWASSAIRAKVKEQEYDRYKIVCVVTIGEKRCEDLYTILRFLWDVERDKFSKYVHETVHLFAIGLCFGIYYE